MSFQPGIDRGDDDGPVGNPFAVGSVSSDSDKKSGRRTPSVQFEAGAPETEMVLRSSSVPHEPLVEAADEQRPSPTHARGMYVCVHSGGEICVQALKVDNRRTVISTKGPFVHQYMHFGTRV
jgi:hypothetical protein